MCQQMLEGICSIGKSRRNSFIMGKHTICDKGYFLATGIIYGNLVITPLGMSNVDFHEEYPERLECGILE